MPREMKITAGGVEAVAELNVSKTANAVWNALPVKARGSTWGDEIYFGIPVQMDEDDAKELVEMGDIAYWPPGSAFCIFFGPTPMSRGSEIRPASAVNVVGKVKGDAKAFKAVGSGETVLLEKA